MRVRYCLAVLGAAVLLGWSAGTASADPPKSHTGPMGHMHMGGMHPMGHGKIVGNIKTHIYHMPGDGSQLPAVQNRIYFATVKQAARAGYHPVGWHKPGGHMAPGHMGHMSSGHMTPNHTGH